MFTFFPGVGKPIGKKKQSATVIGLYANVSRTSGASGK